ncbi:IS4 family transposase, partial [Gordonia sp. TBRC 11910]
EFFGRPASTRSAQAAFPQARIAALAECGTHALFDAVVGPRDISEVSMMRTLVSRLQPGMLCLADRGLYGFDLWSQAAGTGADLLWRVKRTQRPRFIDTLPDGSWLARIIPTSGKGRRSRQAVTVRVIDYTLDDGRDIEQTYRLLTTILDPEQASAAELAAAYHQRWEIESVFDELKTHQRGPRVVLRSKSPALVQQEIWGHLCCHYAVRTLMVDTAADTGLDPDRISFVAALRISRRSLSHSSFSPS